MSSVRINISLPEELAQELDREIGPGKKSRFIAQAIRYFINQKKAQTLAAEYQEAATEIRRVNKEWEEVLRDGLD
jgi:metal-responsive CopG/Arc/MetJ family transcriptional regulator